VANVVRDYGHRDGLSVLLATNKQGRVEVFLFEDRQLAEQAADELITVSSHMDIALVFHGVNVDNTHDAQRFLFSIRGLRVQE
jgi:hypothetical protein